MYYNFNYGPKGALWGIPFLLLEFEQPCCRDGLRCELEDVLWYTCLWIPSRNSSFDGNLLLIPSCILPISSSFFALKTNLAFPFFFVPSTYYYLYTYSYYISFLRYIILSNLYIYCYSSSGYHHKHTKWHSSICFNKLNNWKGTQIKILWRIRKKVIMRDNQPCIPKNRNEKDPRDSFCKFHTNENCFFHHQPCYWFLIDSEASHSGK